MLDYLFKIYLYVCVMQQNELICEVIKRETLGHLKLLIPSMHFLNWTQLYILFTLLSLIFLNT